MFCLIHIANLKKGVIVLKKSLLLVPSLFLVLTSNINAVNAEDNNNGGGYINSESPSTLRSNLDSGIEVNVEPDIDPDTDPDGSNSSSIPSCGKTFYHAVSTITTQVKPAFGDYRTLAWGFNLTKETQRFLGPEVAVTMPVATVNDRPINPPYDLHIREVTYNFHGSLKNYQDMGSSKTLKKGDVVNFNWLITKFPNSTQGAYRYLRCKVL